MRLWITVNSHTTIIAAQFPFLAGGVSEVSYYRCHQQTVIYPSQLLAEGNESYHLLIPFVTGDT